jgi:hypothetical protein
MVEVTVRPVKELEFSAKGKCVCMLLSTRANTRAARVVPFKWEICWKNSRARGPRCRETGSGVAEIV